VRSICFSWVYLNGTPSGAKPQLRKGKLLRAPWLGNWEILRSDSYSAVSNPQKLLLLRRAIKEREDKIQGVRATAPLLHDWIRTFHRIKERVEAAFQGEPFSERYRPDDPRNKNRFEMYLETLKQIFEAEANVLGQWRETFSIEVGDVAGSHIALQQNVLGASANGWKVAAQTTTGQILMLPQGVTAEHIALAQMEVEKGMRYDLDLSNEFKLGRPGTAPHDADAKPKPKPH
jgi:hypothetical protein